MFRYFDIYIVQKKQYTMFKISNEDRTTERKKTIFWDEGSILQEIISNIQSTQLILQINSSVLRQ